MTSAALRAGRGTAFRCGLVRVLRTSQVQGFVRRQAVFRAMPLFERGCDDRGAQTRHREAHFVQTLRRLHFVPTLRRWRNRPVWRVCLRAWRGEKAVPRPAYSAALVSKFRRHVSHGTTFMRPRRGKSRQKMKPWNTGKMPVPHLLQDTLLRARRPRSRLSAPLFTRNV